MMFLLYIVEDDYDDDYSEEYALEAEWADAFLSFVVWLSQSYSRQASTFYSVQHVFVFSFVFQEAALFVVLAIWAELWNSEEACLVATSGGGNVTKV